jgi:hypothetical protein
VGGGGEPLSGTTVCVAPSLLCQVTWVPAVTVVWTAVVSAANVHWMTVGFPDPEPGLPELLLMLDPPQAATKRSRLTVRMRSLRGE